MLQTFNRSFRTAAWLGWQVESNWTDPLLFFAFSVLKPVSSVLILVFMYHAVAGAGSDAPIYAYIFLGNAFYIYVGAVMAGTSYAILDDRERYRTLKYLYIAPIAMPMYLLGRAVARFVVGTLAVVITLLVGIFFLNVPVNLLTVDWPLFGLTLALGIICLSFMGLALGAWTLTIRNEPWFLGDAVAASLYLFSGAIFPITLLPGWLQPLAYGLPVTYWLELLRRATLGPNAAAFPTFAAWSNGQLLAALTGLTLAFGLLAALAFRFFDRLARERGLIDAQSNF
ncbi:MAG: ABC transporter permease [Chloroflexaceae bacterium]|jgi:ABC-2 type transport system permease protein|nr:ABC transporter permease [Chloroflexaceae bacterium]